MFALVDGNNFYASCERVFNPKLIDKPIVVLSNNDGCIIARSSEAKALGIHMAQPLFMVEDIVQAYNVNIFSSNYELYNDMNRRLFDILGTYSPLIEIYSVDESFMDLSNTLKTHKACDYMLLGYRIKDQVQRCLGLPISVGIGKIKTLAKVANHFAKKLSYTKGVLDISATPGVEDLYLNHLAIEDLWGIGRQYSKWLRTQGITSGLQFKQLAPEFVRQHLSVVGLRLHQELSGIPCNVIIAEPKAKKNIGVSRSFGQPLHSYEYIKPAVIYFAQRVATKLRQQGLKDKGVEVMLSTKYFGNSAHYSASKAHNFIIPCQDNYSFMTQADILLQDLFKTGYVYKKAGVNAYGLFEDTLDQDELFHHHDVTQMQKRRNLSQTLDHLNNRFGFNMVNYGTSALIQNWSPQKNRCSSRYTTRFDEILMVR